MDFTFVCPTEILAFSERIAEFEALNTAVIGASTDSGEFIYVRCVLLKTNFFKRILSPRLDQHSS